MKMDKFFKMDEQALFWTILGGSLGVAASQGAPSIGGKKIRPLAGGAIGAAAGLGMRAAIDPQMRAARKAG